MKVLPFVLAAIVVLAPSLCAEERAVTSDLNLMLTQSAYSDNWEGGEAGAISWSLGSNSLAEKQLRAWLHNATSLKLAFGQTHSQDSRTREWASPVKSTDLVDLESVFRFTYAWPVDLYVSGRAKTYFLDERDPEKTRYLNPALFTESVGVARSLIEEEQRKWTVRLGGAVRQHLDRDVLDTDTGERESVIASDGGVEFVTEFRTPLAGDSITFTSRLGAFQAVFNSEEEETPDADDWKTLDVDWENMLSANITSHLVVDLYLELLYDKEISQHIRYKQTVSLGLTFKLG